MWWLLRVGRIGGHTLSAIHDAFSLTPPPQSLTSMPTLTHFWRAPIWFFFYTRIYFKDFFLNLHLLARAMCQHFSIGIRTTLTVSFDHFFFWMISTTQFFVFFLVPFAQQWVGTDGSHHTHTHTLMHKHSLAHTHTTAQFPILLQFFTTIRLTPF